ncbi:hypothetical protein [Glycomyces dulcitolivorans]|jgi:hypothetical protein|uniref:hypothetical protein n=1 Tax=Glycomyces dulcitolivorans TaxID=2200759 RepID=UPI000DD4D28B|nr:hypothetical protein [Glycomyces dulcitolivorans]
MDVSAAVVMIKEAAGLFGFIENPAPVDPTGGSEGLSFLIGSAKYIVLVVCVIVGILSGALIAVGGASKRPDMADLGKKALICSFFGIVVAGTWIAVANSTWTFVG